MMMMMRLRLGNGIKQPVNSYKAKKERFGERQRCTLGYLLRLTWPLSGS